MMKPLTDAELRIFIRTHASHVAIHARDFSKQQIIEAIERLLEFAKELNTITPHP